MERAVITGMGVISPLGNTVGEMWGRLKQGESGIRRIESFDTERYKTRIAGTVVDFDAEGRFGRKEARKMDRFVQFALAAAEQAVEDAGLSFEQIDRERVGVYVGSGIGGLNTLLEQDAILRGRGPERVSPLLVPMMIANMAAASISIRFGTTGPTLAPVTACSIGNTAIGEAMRLIRLGLADVVIAGGAEAAITELSVASFGNAHALSARNEDPARASRPFDTQRDGFVMSEGAGIIVLESLSHAQRREARIYGEIIGYGASSDAYHVVATHPEGAGAQQAMRTALADAAVQAAEVDVISAHATSTELGDRSEGQAISRLFGGEASQIPVTANKSMLGHMLGAAGGVEAIALIQSLREGVIPPTANLEQLDPECGLSNVPAAATQADMRIGLSNSFGFGGHNAVIVVKRFEG
ncbi:3-oxoacyl-(acyl-carrier-protein) synthase 2 [Paenibacillus curdlanolyticus YK9]|uniref:3-oxoacyl-[acyl-carrier-protein] synthase 2 n=1 Tax=Paenibacillus curdlanolyticus YK9 TaxID=717606 RepID=E0IC12_9BACL|nr:beta-ketoacyl-ACP synthase II [Paenibacillus curdlanolyticus]EFM10242.1 3-oxoacyl-(acyl-carrier-protein) synthase 2 [Paenibacillus curdlanolyticus YK9]